jgi:TonB family protein
MADLEKDIERYRKGELTPAEMHALEKRALTDPFLADALEGASSVGEKEFADDVVLLKRELASRTKTTSGRWGWRIAASLVLLATSAVVFYSLLRTPEPLTLAKRDSGTKVAQPATRNSLVGGDSIPDQKKAPGPLLSINRPAPHAAKNKEQEHPALPKAPAAETAQAQPAQPSISADEKLSNESKVEEEVVSNAPQKEAYKKRAAQLNNNAAGANNALESSAARAADKAVVLGRFISGTVTEASGQQPVPGVNVVVTGTDSGTVTDAAGKYRLALSRRARSLSFSFMGYRPQTKEITEEPTADVQLQEDDSALSEVVVTGYGVAGNDARKESSQQLAEPVGGKHAFDVYLNRQVRYPNVAANRRVQGRVTIEFTVQQNGTLSDFKIIKGIGAGCDDELIRLVKEGPAWLPNRVNGVAVDSKVRVDLKFVLPR